MEKVTMNKMTLLEGLSIIEDALCNLATHVPDHYDEEVSPAHTQLQAIIAVMGPVKEVNVDQVVTDPQTFLNNLHVIDSALCDLATYSPEHYSKAVAQAHARFQAMRMVIPHGRVG